MSMLAYKVRTICQLKGAVAITVVFVKAPRSLFY